MTTAPQNEPQPAGPVATSWIKYRGDGKPPDGKPYDSRGERGRYIAKDNTGLVTAVNTAIAVQQPLLVTGESGSGKTMLAWSIASELGMLPVLEFHTRSDHRARDVLFSIDNLKRFYEAQIGDVRAKDLSNYVDYMPLGEAFLSPVQRVVLIDEIDKAPRDFPNDLLDEIDKMAFTPPGAKVPVPANHRPIVIITSNSERPLPDPFLRRCVFHRLAFPEKNLVEILRERLGPEPSDRLIKVAVERFMNLRSDALQLEKLPSTGEMITWVSMLVRAGIEPDRLQQTPLNDLPFLCTLIKSERDGKRLH
jgi:MoxR-like ATPase